MGHVRCFGTRVDTVGLFSPYWVLTVRRNSISGVKKNQWPRSHYTVTEKCRVAAVTIAPGRDDCNISSKGRTWPKHAIIFKTVSILTATSVEYWRFTVLRGSKLFFNYFTLFIHYCNLIISDTGVEFLIILEHRINRRNNNLNSSSLLSLITNEPLDARPISPFSMTIIHATIVL